MTREEILLKREREVEERSKELENDSFQNTFIGEGTFIEDVSNKSVSERVFDVFYENKND
ncbi:MAG: hypothetical protein MJ176_03355 [Treponema sp.]|nr:hypothetical protein [Treponema sp.]